MAIEYFTTTFSGEFENPVNEIATLAHLQASAERADAEHDGSSGASSNGSSGSGVAYRGAPHVSGFVQSGQDETFLYIVTPFYSGGNMYAYLNAMYRHTGTCFPEHQALYVVAHVCRGLMHLHNEGVVHRDIKLQNICIHVDPATQSHTYVT
jgi:serine/threonine protein kinase